MQNIHQPVIIHSVLDCNRTIAADIEIFSSCYGNHDMLQLSIYEDSLTQL